MPFKSLGAVSYSTSIATMAVSVAVCELFSRPHVVSYNRRTGIVDFGVFCRDGYLFLECGSNISHNP